MLTETGNHQEGRREHHAAAFFFLDTMPSYKPGSRRTRRAVAFARAHPVAWILRHVAPQAASVQAPARLWLEWLNQHASDAARASKLWPRSEEQLSRTLADLTEGLGVLGVEIAPFRCRFLGKSSRVWRVETVAAARQRQAQGRSFRVSPLVSATQANPHLFAPKSHPTTKTATMRAENSRAGSAAIGKPKMGRPRLKTPVEECQRITPEEAAHIGARTQETPVAGSSARRLWLLCPQCEKRARFLYQLPGGAAWKCFDCHKLTTRARQTKGTRAAFADWLTDERREELTRQHPATTRLFEGINADWQKNVAPLDWARADAARKLELLEQHGTRAYIQAAFEQSRWEWSGRAAQLSAQAGAQIVADIESEWKARNRSKPTRSE